MWSDEGTVELSGNSCPTRQDVLARDLDDVVRAEDGCTVLSGVLHDRYTGRTIDFERGPRTSLAVQIDHIVPLALGWQSGARELSAEQRLNYANDPENLISTDGPTNSRQGCQGRRGMDAPTHRGPLLVRNSAGPREGQVPVVGHASGEDGPARGAGILPGRRLQARPRRASDEADRAAPALRRRS